MIIRNERTQSKVENKKPQNSVEITVKISPSSACHAGVKATVDRIMLLCEYYNYAFHWQDNLKLTTMSILTIAVILYVRGCCCQLVLHCCIFGLTFAMFPLMVILAPCISESLFVMWSQCLELLVVSNHGTGLCTGLLDWWTGLLDLICSYHMTSIQSNIINLVTVNALHLPTAC